MLQIYKCTLCGKVMVILKEGNKNTICCGKEMEELKPHQLGDKGIQTHSIKIKKKFGYYRLSVGLEDEHPQSDHHYIEWMIVEYENGFAYRKFRIWEDAEICLKSCNLAKPIAVYVMCNIHGLYKTEISLSNK